MNIANYKTVHEWYEDAKKQGYSVPLQLCHCLSKIIEKYNFTFPDAYRFLDQKGKIILKKKMYYFDLSANKLWEDSTSKRRIQ